MRSAAHTPRVRSAILQDIRELTRLCRAAAGPGDYVLWYLREMIAAGEILVAEDRGRIVAMMGVTPCLDRALWLGQARTHPDFRRQGYAQRLAEATGFRPIAVFTRRVARTRRRPSDLRTSRRAAEAFRLWRQSAFYRQGKGYISYQWHFLPLTRLLLQKLAARNELLVGQDIAVVLWTGHERKTAFASVLAGGQKGLMAARRVAGERGYGAVQTFLPREPGIVRWARRAGFRKGSWGTRAVLYERRV